MNSFFIFMSIFFILSAYATIVITNPYDELDYEAINVYHYNNCECPEVKRYQETKLDFLLKY